ncbi:Rdr1p [Drepanopeziza brunnea f. sp. 'multigermtubi' MB_m1]|uniref:Rdr1p n=1 Tax=Marssonina brunnea f. sp. multigermtubi (strain MB_m1) TaxID=1072389 RepID=K1Y078_MARBU|nr:Rdr1p [Drepanopeziza brunnea f. sp. 'multigermtubi' MB_m1]EKD18514.1 Rdr1p [Drepanopeziza brunnea f. sp. 'multigermtubi' MB_m1]
MPGKPVSYAANAKGNATTSTHTLCALPIAININISRMVNPQQHPIKRRYQGIHSVTAFPRITGLYLQSPNPLRVHLFAYNCGIRPEEGSFHADLRNLISKGGVTRYADTYFQTVHSLFVAVDQAEFLASAKNFWEQAGAASVFEAIMADIAALGSFFSATLSPPKQAELVQHAKGILEDPTFQPTIDHVSARSLRSLHLRPTIRPHVAWLVSCLKPKFSRPSSLRVSEENFWTTWRNKTMLSYKYSLSGVFISNITCKVPRYGVSDPGVDLHAISELAPRDLADIQICMADVPSLVEIGNTAIPAALKLAEESKSWWSVLFYRMLQALWQFLEILQERLALNMAREAVNTAKFLLRNSIKKKRAEVEMPEKVDMGSGNLGNDVMTDLEGIDIN